MRVLMTNIKNTIKYMADKTTIFGKQTTSILPNLPWQLATSNASEPYFFSGFDGLRADAPPSAYRSQPHLTPLSLSSPARKQDASSWRPTLPQAACSGGKIPLDCCLELLQERFAAPSDGEALPGPTAAAKQATENLV